MRPVLRFVLFVCVAVALAAGVPAAAFARYEGRATSTHPGAIEDATRNWTYRGDTVRVSFRNTGLQQGQRQAYRVCYTRNTVLSCQSRTLSGPGWDSWRLRVMPPWAGYINGRYTRYVAFSLAKRHLETADKLVARVGHPPLPDGLFGGSALALSSRFDVEAHGRRA
jgi:hypothetical protein